MASVAEAEYGTIFINAKTVVPIITNLNEMGCKQGPMSIQVDNSTAVGITAKSFLQNKSKATNMRLYWINNRIEQGQS